MWWQGQQQFRNTGSSHHDSASHQIHSHSPRRQELLKNRANGVEEPDLMPSGMLHEQPTHPAFRARGLGQDDPFWSQHGPMHDPFTGSANPTSFYKTVTGRDSRSSGDVSMLDRSRYTSSSHDQSMPDYSHKSTSSSSRNISDMGPNAFGHLDPYYLGSMFHPRQESSTANQIDNVAAPHSPRNISTSGISAPSNTRVSSAANTPPKASNAASISGNKDRIPATSNNLRSVSVTTRDLPPPLAYLSSSDVLPSVERGAPGQHTDLAGTMPQQGTVKRKPVGRPKGRKEGKASELDGAKITGTKVQRSATTGSMVPEGKENAGKSPEKTSEGKRKRTSNVEAKVALLDAIGDQNVSSPTRKLSKMESQSISATLDELEELTAEGVKARVPFQELENRI